MPLFFAIALLISGHFAADKLGHPFNCHKNPNIKCEYKVND